MCIECGHGRTSRPGVTGSTDGHPPSRTASTAPPHHRNRESTGPPGTMSGQAGASERPTTDPTWLSRSSTWCAINARSAGSNRPTPTTATNVAAWPRPLSALCAAPIPGSSGTQGADTSASPNPSGISSARMSPGATPDGKGVITWNRAERGEPSRSPGQSPAIGQPPPSQFPSHSPPFMDVHARPQPHSCTQTSRP